MKKKKEEKRDSGGSHRGEIVALEEREREREERDLEASPLGLRFPLTWHRYFSGFATTFMPRINIHPWPYHYHPLTRIHAFRGKITTCFLILIKLSKYMIHFFIYQ